MKHGQSFRVVSVFHPWLFAGPPSASQLELAEWGLFPEENANFWHFRCHLAEGGPYQSCRLPVGLFAPTNAHFSVCHLLEIVGNIHVLALVITSEQAVRRGRDGRIER